jgi:hypothetical protein
MTGVQFRAEPLPSLMQVRLDRALGTPDRQSHVSYGHAGKVVQRRGDALMLREWLE